MKLTLAIIAVCIAVFFLQIATTARDPVTGAEYSFFTKEFALTPSLAFSGHVWQFATYIFLHGDVMHLFLNMFGLLIFGATVENTIGRKKYLLLFFVSGLGSAFVYISLTFAFTPAFLLEAETSRLLLGASGSVFGVMAAYGLLYPRNWIIMFPGIPMPAIVAVAVFAGIEIFYGLTGLQPGIANWGHLGGLVIGVIAITYWKRRARRPKLIIDELEDDRNKGWDYIWE